MTEQPSPGGRQASMKFEEIPTSPSPAGLGQSTATEIEYISEDSGVFDEEEIIDGEEEEEEIIEEHDDEILMEEESEEILGSDDELVEDTVATGEAVPTTQEDEQPEEDHHSLTLQGDSGVPADEKVTDDEDDYDASENEEDAVEEQEIYFAPSGRMNGEEQSEVAPMSTASSSYFEPHYINSDPVEGGDEQVNDDPNNSGEEDAFYDEENPRASPSDPPEYGQSIPFEMEEDGPPQAIDAQDDKQTMESFSTTNEEQAGVLGADDDSSKESRGRRCFLPILLLCLLTLGGIIAVIVTFAVLDNNRSSTTSARTTTDPPFLAPLSPTTTNTPTPSPSTGGPGGPLGSTDPPSIILPATSVPTPFSSPTPTPLATPTPTRGPVDPTIAPVAAPAFMPAPTPPGVPPNDNCENAEGPIFPNADAVVGSIQGATVDPTTPICEGGDLTENRPGVWHWVQGTGGDMIAHTCDSPSFDTQISLFTGTCANLECVDGNDNFCENGGSVVSWRSNAGQLYAIYVHGNVATDATGDYNLVVLSRLNNNCPIAVGPLPVGRGPSVFLGSTAEADPNPEAVGCGNPTSNPAQSPAVWHLVRGTGGRMVASVCQVTEFTARVTVLVSPDDSGCDNIGCIPESSRSCLVQWISDPFRDYYVVVHGSSSQNLGNFALTLTTFSLPDHDTCDTALGPVPLDGRTTVLGDTTDTVSIPSNLPVCNETPLVGSGVWYYIEGDGSRVVASTCDDTGVNQFASRISVYEGDCSTSLTCVVSTQEACGVQSRVSWNSLVGTRYYILVHGDGGDMGEFSLKVISAFNIIPIGFTEFINYFLENDGN